MNQLVHLGIIPDGNRRWARHKGLTRAQGHLAGYKKIKEVCRWCLEENIRILTIYAFSNENWKRDPHEISSLMTLFIQALRDIKEVNQQGFQFRVIGRLGKFSAPVKKAILQAERITKNNTHGKLIIAFGYDGRQELVAASKKMVSQALAGKLKPQDITEDTIKQNLYDPDTPYPDLIIRTGNRFGFSGFLTYQSAQSDIYTLKTLWPDLTQQELIDNIKAFKSGSAKKFGK